MTEVASLNTPAPTADPNILAVTAYTGLHLEPPTKDVVSLIASNEFEYTLL